MNVDTQIEDELNKKTEQEMAEKVEYYDGTSPILKDYGDLYDFITRGEDMEDDIND